MMINYYIEADGRVAIEEILEDGAVTIFKCRDWVKDVKKRTVLQRRKKNNTSSWYEYRKEEIHNGRMAIWQVLSNINLVNELPKELKMRLLVGAL